MLAASAGAHIDMLTLFGVSVLAGQFSIGWSNDYADARLDAAAGRTDKPLATGAAPRSAALIAAVLSLVLCFALALAIGPVTAAWMVPVVGAGWAYNAGLKATPLSGKPNGVPAAAMTTLRIDAGRTDKLRPGDILGALTGDAGLKADAVGKIDVFPTRSYVAVARAQAAQALARLREGKIKGRKFRVSRL